MQTGEAGQVAEGLLLPPVPDLPEPEQGGWSAALPMLGGLGSMGAMVAFAAPGDGRLRAVVMAAAFVASTVAVVGSQVLRQRRSSTRALIRLRRAYAERLAAAQREAWAAAEATRRAAVAESGLLVGWTEVALAVAPAPRTPEADPGCAVLADELLDRICRVEAVPVAVPIDPATAPLRLIGAAPGHPTQAAHLAEVARALACRAAAAGLTVDWQGPAEPWVRWLPGGSGPVVRISHRGDDSWEVRTDSPPLQDGDHARGPSAASAGGTLLLDASGDSLPGPRATLSGPQGSVALSPDRATASEATVRLRNLTAPTRERAVDCVPDPRHLDPQELWRRRGPAPLRARIGQTDDGAPLDLTLSEPALGGIGPHGVLVGATGSGKSELLRTLVLSLALNHSTEQLNLLLIDFKGGAAFTGLAELPHVCGLVTNLADDSGAVARMQAALEGEVTRRQEVLGQAGCSSAYDLAVRAATAPDPTVPTLPSLLIVIDEFAELLQTHPDLAETCAAIGRVGRSLGLHLLLSTQRLDEGRLRGLESHLSYRLALRTFSEAESHQVLGRPDAALLPRRPGVGLLRPQPGTLIRFQAGYVSGPPAPAGPEARIGVLRPGWRSPATDTTATAAEAVPSLVELAVARLRESPPSRAVRRIWQPPLPAVVPLETLLARAHGQTGLDPTRIPIGVVDLPQRQRREALCLDLAQQPAHLAVVGSTRTGKTTALATVARAAAAALPPDRLHLWVFAFGGGDPAAWDTLPHLRALADPGEPDFARRCLRHLTSLLAERTAAGPGRAAAQQLVVVDGWESLTTDLPDVAEGLGEILRRGLGAGLIVAASASRWSSLRPAQRDAFGRRIELALTDPVDSEIDRRRSAAVPAGRPGRGIVAGPYDVQVALPTSSGELWPGQQLTRLRPLPTALRIAEIEEGRLPRLGLRESGEPLLLPPLGLVVGAAGSGKSRLLSNAVAELTRTATPGDRQLLLLQPRTDIAPGLEEKWLLAKTGDPDEATEAVSALARVLTTRPCPSPEVWLIVDDAELLGGAVWAPVAPLLPRADALGLRVLVATRAHGAARALHDPLLDQLRQRGDTLLLTGPPEEGPLAHGHRLRSLPPGRALVVAPTGGAELAQLVEG